MWYVAAHTGLVCHNAAERPTNVLVTLAHGVGHKVTGGISLELTNEQFACAANVTQFTVSRLMNQWQRNGLIVKNRGKVLLRCPERLFAECSGKSAAGRRGSGRTSTSSLPGTARIFTKMRP